MMRPIRSSRVRARTVRGAALALLAFTASACGGASQEPEAAAPTVVQVGRENVAVVTRDRISTGPLLSGTLNAARSSTVRAEVGGQILGVHAEEGQSVRRGTLLARIEDQPLQDAFASMQSAVRSADHALDVAQREATRTTNLVKAGALPERDAEVAQNNLVAAQAQVADAKARLASARKQLANATVHSPMAGIVSKRPANSGDVVSQGDELFTIIDPSSMRLEGSVPSESLSAITIGAPVLFEVRGYPEQQFEGRIERIRPEADAITRQVPIFVSLPNKGGRLVSGLFAEGRVTRESRDALVVPETAVNVNGATPWVMRVRDGKAEKVDVTIGLRDEQTERVEIASGVQQGDVLLTGPAQGMTPGTPVKVQNGDQQNQNQQKPNQQTPGQSTPDQQKPDQKNQPQQQPGGQPEKSGQPAKTGGSGGAED